MTLTEFLVWMIMPVGGLLIGLLMLYITRKDRQHITHKPGHPH